MTVRCERWKRLRGVCFICIGVTSTHNDIACALDCLGTLLMVAGSDEFDGFTSVAPLISILHGDSSVCRKANYLIVERKKFIATSEIILLFWMFWPILWLLWCHLVIETWCKSTFRVIARTQNVFAIERHTFCSMMKYSVELYRSQNLFTLAGKKCTLIYMCDATVLLLLLLRRIKQSFVVLHCRHPWTTCTNQRRVGAVVFVSVADLYLCVLVFGVRAIL